MSTRSATGASQPRELNTSWCCLIRAQIPGTGLCSPLAPMPPGWPGVPPTATSLCWGYPLDGVSELGAEMQPFFLNLSTSAELSFAACVPALPPHRPPPAVSAGEKNAAPCAAAFARSDARLCGAAGMAASFSWTPRVRWWRCRQLAWAAWAASWSSKRRVCGARISRRRWRRPRGCRQ